MKVEKVAPIQWSKLGDYVEADRSYREARAILRRARSCWMVLRRRGVDDEVAYSMTTIELATRRVTRARRIVNAIRNIDFCGITLLEAVWSAPDDL